MSRKETTAFAKFRYATMRGCTIAIVMLLLFFFFISLSVDYAPAMPFGALATLVLFSLAISYSYELFSLEAIPLIVRWLLNFFIIAIAFFFVLLATTKAYVVGFILYTVAYLLIAGCSAIFRRIFKKKQAAPQKDEQQYTRRFS